MEKKCGGKKRQKKKNKKKTKKKTTKKKTCDAEKTIVLSAAF
jgi:hypothetical protein